jgi:hypothetical protein
MAKDELKAGKNNNTATGVITLEVLFSRNTEKAHTFVDGSCCNRSKVLYAYSWKRGPCLL